MLGKVLLAGGLLALSLNGTVAQSNNTGFSKATALRGPILNLPTGPGSIAGLGEAFTPNLNSGTSSQVLRLTVPPGRNGLAPDIAIAYNSGFGNGLLGLGHKLTIPTIQRQTDKGLPNYSEWGRADKVDNDYDGNIDEFDEFDTFINHQGEELVLVEDGVYRTKNADDFARYKRLKQGWVITQSNGQRLYLGQRADSRLSDASGEAVFAWYLEAIEDPHGNRIDYHYRKLDNSVQIYLDKISYNSNGDMGVQFHYEPRPDILNHFKAGFEIKTAYRLQRAEVVFAERTLRSYAFSYQPLSPWQSQSLLEKIQLQAGSGENAQVLPPIQYSYTQYQEDAVQIAPMPEAGKKISLNPATTFLDMNLDGLPDIINTGNRKDTYWLNLGPDADGVPQWQDLQEMTTFSNSSITDKSATWADVDGNGAVNLLLYASKNLVNYFHLNENLSWEHSGTIEGLQLATDNPGLQMVDINNDKRIDVFKTGTDSRGKVINHVVQLNLPDGWSQPILLPMPKDSLGTDLADPNTFLFDMNGDGLADLVEVGGGFLAYFPHRGLRGFGPMVRFNDSPDTLFDIKKVRIADMNADGRGDLVYLNGNRIRFWLNQGLDSTEPQRALLSEQQMVEADIPALRETHLVDINGNGSTDIVWYSPGKGSRSFIFAELFPNEQPNQLKTIDNGIGAQTTLTYGSVAEEMIRDRDTDTPWHQGIPVAMQVLKRIAVNDGLDGVTQITEMDYSDGFYDSANKEFQGFANTEERRLGDATSPTLITDYQFHLGQQLDGTKQEALKGKVKQVETRDLVGDVFWREENQWELRELLAGHDDETRSVQFAAMTSREQHWQEQGRGEPVTLAWEYDYDDYGNTTYIKELGRTDGDWEDERITQLRYSAETASAKDHWQLHLPIAHEVTDLQGQPVAREQWYYDDESFAGNNLGQVSKGNLTLRRVWAEADQADTSIAAERHKYDDYGNRTHSYDPLWGSEPGHETAITYDDQYHTFATQARLHTGSRWLSATASYDKGLGLITGYTDYNAQRTQFRYDALGRLIARVEPGDSLQLPTLAYDYQLAQEIGDQRINWVETRQREQAGNQGTINSRHYYDGLGRTLMVKSEADQSGQVVVSEHNRYNARGQVETSYLPYFAEGLGYKINQSGPHYRETHYDALGRTKTVYQPPVNGEAASFQRITYQPLVQLLEDEEQTRSGSIHAGAAKRLTFDGLQNAEGEPRLRQLDEIVTAGTDSNSATTRSTRYDYDLNNYFIRLQDAQNNVRNTHYDALGRLRFLSDPNRGQQWQYFDDAGNLLASRDALGQERHYRYDGANRISAEYYLPSRSPAPSNGHWQPDLKLGSAKAVVNYQYDELETSKETKAVKANAGFLLGRLAKVTDQVGFEQRSYDARGQLIQRDRKITGPGINSPVYSSRFSYDSAGRPTKQTYPNGTWVDFHYNARGLLERIPGVVEQLDYNPNGALTHRQMANGIKTDWQFDARQRLATITSTRATDSLKLQQLDYRFDAASNVMSIRDGRPDKAITTMASELGAANQPISALAQDIVYSYDNLYRLTEVANPREQANYRYDAIGNLLNFSYSDLDNSADSTHSIDLRYGGSSDNSNKGASNRVGRTPKDPPGPHAVSWDGSALIYDDNGNQIRAGEHQYHWDHDQRLIKTSDTNGTTQYGYDYQHQRRFKITDNKDGSQSITLYIDGDSEVRDGQLHNYVSLGDKRIARSTQKREGEQSGQADGPFTPSEYYLHNHLGSTALTLDQDAELINAFSYKVYGELENVYGDSTAAPYRFTGKEQDKETGLGYFERRYLNQEYGSFISPDSLLNHSERFTDPQRWSPYRYARNNPINYVDPDGRESRFAIRLDARIESLASGAITQQQYSEAAMAEGVGAVTALTLMSPIDEVAIGAAVIGKAAGGAYKTWKAAKLAKAPKSAARVPGRVQSRINLSNDGVKHTLDRHLNPAKAGNKSQFTIGEDGVHGLLSAKSTIQAPARALETGNFARTIKTNRTVGNLAEKMGGGSTNTFTVITDKAGNLQTAFPGGL